MTTTGAATMPRRWVTLLLAALLAVAGMVAATPQAAHAAVGGPVILGGDDLTDHGSYDGSANLEGWLYLEKAIANIKPRVTRAGADGSIAALGSVDPGFDPTQSYAGDAGAAIASAGRKNSMPVKFYGTEAAINQFFADLRSGAVKPSIIWIAGNDASNDLGDNGGGPALSANASTIGDFVNSGGGLMSHGTDYSWLGGVLPGVTMPTGGSSDDLALTPQGQAAFPGLTNTDVNAGPWHGFFEGDIGGLQVLVTSSTVKDSQNRDARVIIGGASVSLPGTISLTPATATNPVGTSHTVTATVRNPDGTPRSGVVVSFSVTSGPDQGATGSGTTDSQGKTTYTFSNTAGAGTDTITASFTENQVTYSDTATKTFSGSAQGSTSGTMQGQGRTACGSSISARAVRCPTFRFSATKAASGVSGSASLVTRHGRFTARKITAAAVNGSTGTFTASGTWRGRSGYTLRAKVTDGQPDTVQFKVTKGKRSYFYTSRPIASGFVVVTP